MPKEVYRTYEVLVEETVSPNDPKRKRTSKPNRSSENTTRALQTTHRLFQDAVCDYIFMLVAGVESLDNLTQQFQQPLK